MSRRSRKHGDGSRPCWRRAGSLFVRVSVFEPHPPHHLSQRHRPARARHRHSLSLPVPRRPDRRARPEPAGAGRDHRRRHRGLRDGGDRHHHHRSRAAARPAGRRELRALGRGAVRARIPDQSGARRAGAAPAGLADQYARAHLRPRRRPHPRQPQPVSTCCASICRRRRRSRATSSAPMSRSAPGSAAARCRSIASSDRRTARATARWRNALQGFKSSMVRINERGEVIVSVAVPVQRFRAVRGALMLSTQGADIDNMVGSRAARDLQGVPDRLRRDGGAVVPARGHHRRAGAAARRKRRSSCAGASARAWRSPI